MVGILDQIWVQSVCTLRDERVGGIEKSRSGCGTKGDLRDGQIRWEEAWFKCVGDTELSG